MNPIWKDPVIVDVLKEREADDIMVIACPRCGKYGYYNQGSHFSCSHCDIDFCVLGEDERAEGQENVVHAFEAILLSDLHDDYEEGP